ncbi:Major facilitator superfamily domain-containing protein 6-A [Lucilia cuprina]|nr:Major facilitator superfamily domain-containing protein 6-A [Lucilia cuprina]
MGAFSRKPRVNKTLISLKVVAFFVLSGISALHILNNRMPSVLGLNFNEYRDITIIASFVSILGPLIAGPLADRFAAKNPNNFGKTLRILTAIFLLITAIIYACLFAVPEVKRGEAHQPLVSFGCDANGAVIFQQRCSEDNQCHHWKSKVGSVNLTRCTYTCQDPTQYENMYTPWLESIPTPSPSTEHSSEFDYEDESTAAVTESLRQRRNAQQQQQVEQSSELGAAEVMSSEILSRQKRQYKSSPNKVYVEPPHLCMTEKNEEGESVVKNCHVYTDDTTSILVHTVMKAATNVENDTHSAEWCNYPLEGFQCQIPLQQANYMIQLKNNSDCKPMIECQVIDPYGSKGSVLADSECVKIEGDLDSTLGGYTAIRILGDIFALACLTLLNTAIVIAVRETSEGRGEVCRQYAWGAVGYVILFCSLDLFFFKEAEGMTVALILVIVCFVLGALVLLFASQMPLSPPEWWWHTKTGMLVYPMSAIRKYSPEIFVLTLVAILFGTFWGSIHSYLYWSYLGEYAAYFSGLLLILVLFFNVDKFIEYCGHSNIFIGGFAMFIIRFTALASKDTDWLTNLMEIIEPVILGIVWITIILYMRHAMPRKFTATGQALAVIAFFALGKGFGALIGLVHDDKKGIHNDDDLIKFEWLSVTACIIALIYFVIYNLILAPRCAAKPVHLDDLMSGSASQTFANGAGGAGGNGSAGGAVNGNGTGASNGNSYSPLRVYHNERGKKGQFRY